MLLHNPIILTLSPKTRERRLRFEPRVTLPLLFSYFFSFNQDRTERIFAAVGAVGMCVNGQRGGAVGNNVCGLWESWQFFHRAVNICFPSAERPFSTFPIAENSMIAYLYIAFPQERIYNELWLVNANYNSDSWRKLWEY